jgi:polyisoprenoid-binding protein YceI
MTRFPRGSTRVLVVLGTSLAAGPLGAAPRNYAVDPAASSVRIHVGKTGAFSFAGHTHEVVAPALSGEVTADPENLSGSRVALSFDAGALKVVAEGEPAGDAPKVEEAMRGPKTLDAARFPAITFKSGTVTGHGGAGGPWDLQVAGEMSLHGVTRALTLPVRVELQGDTLTASGEAVLRQDEFGIHAVSAGGGTVKVKNEVQVSYKFVARAR